MNDEPRAHDDTQVWVRDAVSVRRIVLLQTLALLSMLLWSCYPIGAQLLRVVAADVVAQPDVWRQRAAVALSGLHPDSLWDSWWYGALYLLPLALTIFTVTAAWEFAAIRKRRRLPQADVCVHALLLTLLLPAMFSPWAAIPCAVLMMMVREALLGYQRVRVHPVAAAYVLLTLLLAFGNQRVALLSPLTVGLETLPLRLSWWDVLLGSAATTAGAGVGLLAALFGAMLLAAGIYSWRVVAGALTGMIATVLFCRYGFGVARLAELPWFWFPILGETLLAIFFIAADPGCAASTRGARFSAGLAVGACAALLRLFTPLGTASLLLAVLAGNLLSFAVEAIYLRRAEQRAQRFSNKL